MRARSRPQELQYFCGNYRQVLNSEGLSAFVNAQLRVGKPGTAARSVARLQDPEHRRRSRLQLSGHPPAREEPDAHRPVLQRRPAATSLGRRSIRATGCAASASRPMPTGPTLARHQPAQRDRTARASRGSAAPRTATRCASRASRPRRLHQDRGDRQPRCSRCSRNFSLFGRATANTRFNPLLVARAMRLWRPLLRPRLRSVGSCSAISCFEALGELRYDFPVDIKDADPGPALRLCRLRQAVEP